MKIAVPGKMMLAGEWAVLEVSCPCIVIAIDSGVYVEIVAAEEIGLCAPGLGISQIRGVFRDNRLQWQTPLDAGAIAQLEMSRFAIEITLGYLQSKGKSIQAFHITTHSEETRLANGVKIGLGSSASICVAIVAAILHLHGLCLNYGKTGDLVYKAACIAHYMAQKQVGSGFDIAASTWGGTLFYQRFAPNWLMQKMTRLFSISELIETHWPNFYYEKLSLPDELHILLGFVGYSASTTQLIEKVSNYKQSSPRQYQELIRGIGNIVKRLKIAIIERDCENIVALVRENRKSLRQLSEQSQAGLETSELALLADIAEEEGGAGKFCGAGGGDCGIAVALDSQQAQRIAERWRQSGITPLPLVFQQEGVQAL